MKHFIALVHKEADSAYGVQFPDVPGCFSAADAFEDLLPNAVDALTLYFEDEEMIAPRDLEAVREVVQEDLAEGAFLLAVPLIENRQKKTSANISMDRGMLDAIDSAAGARGLTRSGFIIEAARREIEGRH